MGHKAYAVKINKKIKLCHSGNLCHSIFAKRTKIAKFRYLRKARSSKGIRLLIVFGFKTVQNVNPLYFL
ncbi:MAG: hypothetical protein IKV83_01795, partial [Muribaculaceae bacterium]|nr:hypothetical protein [Muribaculaceae bacterium]